MNIEVSELIKGIGNSDILGIGKNENGDIYVTQGHFIIRVEKDLLINNIRLATTISSDFKIEDVEEFIENIELGKMIMNDDRVVWLSDLFYNIEGFKSDYDRVSIIEHNIEEDMTLLENKVSRKQIVASYEYLNMVKGYSEIYGKGEFNPLVIIDNSEVMGYILPMRVANKKEFFKYGI